jgi:hypothetical protein
MNNPRNLISQTAILVFGLIILSACEQQFTKPAIAPTATVEAYGQNPPSASATKEVAPTPTPKPSHIPTYTPTPDPQLILLRGAPGCEHEQNIFANSRVQLHYGVWGSVGKAYAEGSWDLLDISLTMDGEEIEGEKQPVSADLIKHCGSDAEDVYWMFYIVNIEGIHPGVHDLEVTYYANALIEDCSGQYHGPGTLFTHSFTLNATQIPDEALFDAPILATPSVERFLNNPILVPEMLLGDDGANINGPSLIRVPPWVDEALGKYYLYFAHHIGANIRLAYADDLAGPWNVYDAGTLRLGDTICNDIAGSIYADYKHVASPDVHVDHESQQIRMYFHCPVYISGPVENDNSYKQVTLLATSSDGLSFEPLSEPLGNAYFRVFQWDEYSYAISMPGVFYRSADGLSGFEEGPTLFSEDMRHSAVIIRDEKLLIFYTMVGDKPERILLSEVELLPDWMTWSATEPVTVLEPEFDWEGANLPLEPSFRGTIMEPVRQLRDPAIFVEDGRSFLLYSIAGESGIAIAELHWR